MFEKIVLRGCKTLILRINSDNELEVEAERVQKLENADNPLWTKNELREYLGGLSTRTLEGWMYNYDDPIPFIKDGVNVFFSKNAVRAWCMAAKSLVADRCRIIMLKKEMGDDAVLAMSHKTRAERRREERRLKSLNREAVKDLIEMGAVKITPDILQEVEGGGNQG